MLLVVSVNYVLLGCLVGVGNYNLGVLVSWLDWIKKELATERY